MVRVARSGVIGMVLVAASLVLPGTAASAVDGRPAVGQCRDLGPRQVAATSNTTAPRSCSLAHTARTIAVRSLPRGETWSVLKHPSVVADVAARLCMPAFRSAVGGTYSVRERTAYTYVYFAPTVSQRKHGARWLRCDLVLLAGTHLAALPTDRKPAVKGPINASVARCLTGARYTTTCSRAHDYRAVATFSPSKHSYPSATGAQAAANAHCPALVHSSTFAYTYPPRPFWTHGDHQVVCYAKTTS